MKRVARRDVSYGYRIQQSLLTSNEMRFYWVLHQVISKESEGRWIVVPKVRLKDVVAPVDEVSHPQAWEQIKGMHLDFVVAEFGTLFPWCCVELDDSSHLSEKAQWNDRLKDGALLSACVGLVRVALADNYESSVIWSAVKEAVLASKRKRDGRAANLRGASADVP